MSADNNISNMNDNIKCTGCSACFNSCAVHAIAMNENDEGFQFPTVDEDLCTHCGLCLKICPSLNPVYSNITNPACYAVMADDETRKQSTSGAIFPLLAEQIFNESGYVCGAAFNTDFEVEHIIINKIDDLHRLKGSKYVQSDTKDCYSRINGLLEDGKQVLFTGTPCQNAGLKAFLQKDYDNLICVDLICHGTPSPKVLRMYLNENFKKGTLRSINFRNKELGWTASYTEICAGDQKIKKPPFDDSYMNAFLSNISLRMSCFACPFQKIPRQGDITIGDFWGIDKHNKKFNDEKGTSVVLINNAKGLDIIDKIKSKTKLFKPVPLKIAIKGNPNLITSSKISDKRDTFFKNLKEKSFEESFNIVQKGLCDCAILNYWFGSNYGAILTAFASQKLIDGLGYHSKIIQYVPEGDWLKKYKNSVSQKFAEKYLNTTGLYTEVDELRDLNNLTNTFIVGSDQVWRYVSAGWHQAFYFNFVNCDKKKIAHAVSFGVDYFEAGATKTELIKFLIKRFDYISIREKKGLNICKNDFDVLAEHIVDPVFAINKSEYETIINNRTTDPSQGLVSYVLDNNKKINRLHEFVSKKYNEPVNLIEGGGIGVENWLSEIADCKLLITDSFHGTCFAIIFNKPFICVINKERGGERFISLLNTFGIPDHYIENPSEINNRDDLFQPLDYTNINLIIEQEKTKHINWLKNALNAPPRHISEEQKTIDFLLNKTIKFESDINQIKRKVKDKDTLKKERKTYLQYNIYKLLSVISFGKSKKKYKEKRKIFKQKMNIIRGKS